MKLLLLASACAPLLFRQRQAAAAAAVIDAGGYGGVNEVQLAAFEVDGEDDDDDDSELPWNDAWNEDYYWAVSDDFGSAQLCVLNGCPLMPLNLIELRFCGAAQRLKEDVLYPFDDLADCGLRTEEDCSKTPTEAGNECEWGGGFGADHNGGGPLLVTDSCVPGVLNDPKSQFGMLFYGEGLNATIQAGEAKLPLFTERDIWTCVQHSRGTAEECAAVTDTSGHPCAMCENVPGIMYPFIDAPLMTEGDDTLQQWCLPTHNFPTMCLMLRGKMIGCDEVDDRPRPTKPPPTTTAAPESTTTPDGGGDDHDHDHDEDPNTPKGPGGPKGDAAAFGLPAAAAATAAAAAVAAVFFAA